ncbi:MAG: hypothetical protein CMJ59_17930 [Planctomycetaceae bacterium]|nr:hypothetical protein [Planctomycetaceae bacterium]
MEIVALLKSLSRDIRDYLLTRVVLPRMAALLALLVTAAWCHSGSQSLPLTWIEATFEIGLVVLLLSQFRLWDDLADVHKDGLIDPQRVLCRTAHRASFMVLVVLLAVGSISLLAGSRNVRALGLLGGLTLLMIGWYAIPARTSWTVMNYHVVLLKYPVFILLMEAPTERIVHPATMGAALAVYLILCVFEVCHDPTLRSRTGVRVLAGAEGLLLVVSIATMTGATS